MAVESLVLAACLIAMPPAQFDSGPVSVRETILPRSMVNGLCNGGPSRVACTITFADKAQKLVVLPMRGAYGCTVDDLRRHEYGHARGWHHS